MGSKRAFGKPVNPSQADKYRVNGAMAFAALPNVPVCTGPRKKSYENPDDVVCNSVRPTVPGGVPLLNEQVSSQ